MMKRFFLIILLVLLFIDLSSQVNRYGVPFVENYSTQLTGGSEQYWCITKDAFGNVWFGNQDRGVTKYDGTSWTNIPVKDNPRMFALEADERGIVYVAAAYEFGYIQPSVDGGYEYISLSERVDSVSNILYVYSIVIEENIVHFLSPKTVFKYDIINDGLSVIDLTDMGVRDANRLCKISDKMIIADQLSGLYLYDGERATLLPKGDVVKDKFCTVLLPFGEEEILIAPYGDRIFLYDMITGDVDYSFVSSSLNDIFKDEAVYSAVMISEDLYAISTTIGGVYVVDRDGELIQHISTESNSLLDNTVYAMYCDCPNNSELWIATYGYISKASLNLPINIFETDYNINEICEFNGDIILSTDAGLIKMVTDEKGEARFSDIITGTSGQIFPLRKFETSEGEFLLAGHIDGVLQIDKDYGLMWMHENVEEYEGDEFSGFNARKILPSVINPGVVYFGNDPSGLNVFRYEKGSWNFIANHSSITNGVVSALIENEDGSLWVITTDPSEVMKITDPLLDKDTAEYFTYGPDKGVPGVRVLSAGHIDGDMFISTASGLYRYDWSSDRFVADNSPTGGFSEGIYSQSFFSDNDGDLWYSGLNDTYFDMIFHEDNDTVTGYRGILDLLPNTAPLGSLVKDERVYLTKSKIVAVIDKDRIVEEKNIPGSYFVNIVVGTDTIMGGQFYVSVDENRRVPVIYYPESSVPEYRYDMNTISFEWTTPYFTEELRTEYSYMLEGYETGWSAWEGISFGYNLESIFAYYANRQYENLPYGRYIFRVRARTVTGMENGELSFEFEILKPWYLTTAAIILWIVIIGAIIMCIMAIYTKRLKDENIRLEGIVEERTAVVVKQKEELEASIHYASRIQFALLPSKKILNENIKNNFILFRPRDIVSGDYYWMSRKGERLYIVAADCTGHGVPGAFMSLLGMSFLEEIVRRQDAPPANLVLNQLRQHVIESLKQEGKDDETNDGMDMGLLVFDFDRRIVEYSGAYNPCYKVRKMNGKEISDFKSNPDDIPKGFIANGKYIMEVIEASKMPIGISRRMQDNFTLYSEDMQPDVAYYLSSDGYIDQFGGESDKKFMKKNFKRLLLAIQDKSMDEQQVILEKKLEEWMGSTPQIDDIIVLGVKTD